MTKPLSEMLEAIEPKIFRWHHVNRDQFTATPIGCDYVPRKSYDRMKRVAIELAKALEGYAIADDELDAPINQAARDAISRAKDIIGGE